GAERAHVGAGELDPAGGRLEQPQDGAPQGRLARPASVMNDTESESTWSNGGMAIPAASTPRRADHQRDHHGAEQRGLVLAKAPPRFAHAPHLPARSRDYRQVAAVSNPDHPGRNATASWPSPGDCACAS